MKQTADFLREAGIGFPLVEQGWHPDVESALRDLKNIMTENHADELMRQSVRTAVLEVLKSGKIQGASRLVDAAIGKPERNRDIQGREIAFFTPELWDKPMDGQELFTEVKNFISRYLILPPGGLPVIAMWSIATWAVAAFDIVPYLLAHSPTRECGKTRLLEVIELLARKAFRAVSASEATIFRITEKEQPTMLLDEAEALSQKSDRSDAIIRILNDGFERGPGVPRCEGEKNEVRFFAVYGFKAIASIKRLWDTVEGRSIIIHMQRKSRTENVERFRRKKARREAHDIARRIARWVRDHIQVIESAQPDLPDFMGDREQDIWECLLAVALVIGEDVYYELIEAAKSLRCEDEDNSTRIQVIKDLKIIFGTKDKMFSETICEELWAMEDRRWPEYRNGKKITRNQLARLLKDFHTPNGLPIRPQKVRIGLEVKQGYRRQWFDKILVVYAPDPSVELEHPEQSGNDKGFSEFSNRNIDPQCSTLKSD